MLYILVWCRGQISCGGYFSTYYINLSIFLAFAASYPDMELLLYFILPIKIKWMATGVCEYSRSCTSWQPAILFIAHSDHFITFKFCRVLFIQQEFKTVYTKRTGAQSGNSSTNRQRPHMTYANGARHRCAVCGTNRVG